MLSQTYENLKIKIQTELSESCFCHIQLTYKKNEDKDNLSFRAQYLDESFEYKHRDLHCKKTRGPHIGFNI